MAKDTTKDFLAGLSIPELCDLHDQYKGDISDEGARIYGQIRSRLMRLRHADQHPDEDVYPFNVPYAADGTPFEINGVPISGYQELPACVLQQVLYMIYCNKQIELERMQSGGKIIDMGDIANSIATLTR